MVWGFGLGVQGLILGLEALKMVCGLGLGGKLIVHSSGLRGLTGALVSGLGFLGFRVQGLGLRV